MSIDLEKRSEGNQLFVLAGGVTNEDYEEAEASSLGEFARALFLGLGALLVVSVSTFALFYGIVAALLGLVT